MNGFFVTISNDLLEEKHYEKMGTAVWLYMWLIDKMTEISEGMGIVNGGYPVSIENVRENFTGMPERTYHRMIATLRKEGYINTSQAKYGLYITVNKPKKHFNRKVVKPAVKSSPAKNGLADKKSTPSPAKNGNQALPKMAPSPAKNGEALYKDDNTITIQSNNTSIGDKKSPAKKDPHKELISKLYYDAVKALDLPIRNHNTVRSKIAEMAREKDKDRIIKYLEFISGQYKTLEWDYKPDMNEALDIYAKRAQVRNSFSRYLKTSKNQRGVKL